MGHAFDRWTRVTRAGLSVAGRRAANEDSHAFDEPADPTARARRGTLIVVADGMSGQAGAAEASETAVRMVVEGYAAACTRDVVRDLTAAIAAANRAVHARSMSEPGLEGMGTTLTALVLRGDLAIYAHVGDSRAYLVREGEITQLTRDHSVLEALRAREAVLAASGPPAHLLTRALGVWDRVEAEIPAAPLPIRAGDLFLLCTDGLNKALDDPAILAVLVSHDPAAAAEALVALALERGATDNITVEVVRVDGIEAAPAVAG